MDKIITGTKTDLTIRNVSFSYEESDIQHPILDEINLNCREESITVIIGPSGCGKTTLLNLIAGVLEPGSGEIIFSKRGLREIPKVGYVFQTPSLIPWKSILDNVLIGAQIRNICSPAVIERAEELLLSYGLKDYRNAFPSSLSGGMQQRVSIIRAVISGAEVLLLDEPFANTDIILRKALQEDLLRIVSEQKLIALFVTHDLIEAVKIADNVVILSHRPTTVYQNIKISINRKDRMQTGIIVKNDLYKYIETINDVLVDLDILHKKKNA